MEETEKFKSIGSKTLKTFNEELWTDEELDEGIKAMNNIIAFFEGRQETTVLIGLIMEKRNLDLMKSMRKPRTS